MFLVLGSLFWYGVSTLHAGEGCFGAGQYAAVEKVTVQRAAEAFAGVAKDMPPDANMVLKIDCEGAEYDILGDLLEANVPKAQPDVIIGEWHTLRDDKSVDALSRLLCANGYSFYANACYADSGLFVASKVR